MKPKFKTGDKVAIIGTAGYWKGEVVCYHNVCPDDGLPSYKVKYRFGTPPLAEHEETIVLCESVLFPSNEEPNGGTSGRTASENPAGG